MCISSSCLCSPANPIVKRPLTPSSSGRWTGTSLRRSQRYSWASSTVALAMTKASPQASIAQATAPEPNSPCAQSRKSQKSRRFTTPCMGQPASRRACCSATERVRDRAGATPNWASAEVEEEAAEGSSPARCASPPAGPRGVVTAPPAGLSGVVSGPCSGSCISSLGQKHPVLAPHPPRLPNRSIAEASSEEEQERQS